MYLTPCNGHFCNLYILCVNVSKNARDNIGINMCHHQVVKILEYGALLIFETFVHNTPIIFSLWWLISSGLLESFAQKSGDAFRVPHIAFLSSSYMNFLCSCLYR